MRATAITARGSRGSGSRSMRSEETRPSSCSVGHFLFLGLRGNGEGKLMLLSRAVPGLLRKTSIFQLTEPQARFEQGTLTLPSFKSHPFTSRLYVKFQHVFVVMKIGQSSVERRLPDQVRDSTALRLQSVSLLATLAKVVSHFHVIFPPPPSTVAGKHRTAATQIYAALALPASRKPSLSSSIFNFSSSISPSRSPSNPMSPLRTTLGQTRPSRRSILRLRPQPAASRPSPPLSQGLVSSYSTSGRPPGGKVDEALDVGRGVRVGVGDGAREGFSGAM